MTITASIERLTPLSYVHDEPKIQTEAERGAYIVGFHRARAKALQIGAQYEEDIDELRETLRTMTRWVEQGGSNDNNESISDIVEMGHATLAKATGGEG